MDTSVSEKPYGHKTSPMRIGDGASTVIASTRSTNNVSCDAIANALTAIQLHAEAIRRKRKGPTVYDGIDISVDAINGNVMRLWWLLTETGE